MELKQTNQFPIKIRTMEGQERKIIVQNSTSIAFIKSHIEASIGIPKDRQRLVFSGRLLSDSDTIGEIGVQQNHAINLIATLSKANDDNQNDNVSSHSFNEEQGNEIVEGIFRNLIILKMGLTPIDNTTSHRRERARMLLQQRHSGFMISGKDSLEVIRQNLLTLEMVEKTSVPMSQYKKGKSRLAGFDNSDRKFTVGQWVDAKDQRDQWLEAEVLKIRGKQALIHFNGYAYRMDEWIDMNSPRIAAFRAHTVNSPYSLFMSPNPTAPVDGDHSSRDKESDSPNINKTIIDSAKSSTSIGDMLIQFEEALIRKENLRKKMTHLKSDKSALSMKTKKNKIKLGIKKKKLKSVYTQQEKPTSNPVIRDDRCETQSNLSFTIHESDKIIPIKDIRDDCQSMKSLKLCDEKNNKVKQQEKDIDDHGDSISSKSFKSQISANMHFNFEYISEEHSNEHENEDEGEDDDEDDIEDLEEGPVELVTTTAREEKKLLDKELYIRATQLAPMLDRVGRLLIDLAPHIAMIGASVVQPHLNNLSSMSVITNDGSLFSGLRETLGRLGTSNPAHLANNVNNASISNNERAGVQSNQENQNSANILSTHGRSMNFELPIMLNAGELLSVGPSLSSFVNDGQVQLNLNAVVRIPDDFVLTGPSKHYKSTQTTELLSKKDRARSRHKVKHAVSEKQEEGGSVKTHEFNEGLRKWRWDGQEQIRETDLDGSFCGTIDERDEDEPEMQDISFKELGSEEKGNKLYLECEDDLIEFEDSIIDQLSHSPAKIQGHK